MKPQAEPERPTVTVIRMHVVFGVACLLTALTLGALTAMYLWGWPDELWVFMNDLMLLSWFAVIGFHLTRCTTGHTQKVITVHRESSEIARWMCRARN